ncbi:acyl-CoA dehydrogenase family protein [Mycobacterium shimoidei]|uniref:acyl-CoA dehydrogenase family protein n=1 Tax=Mycobacterium shimoidei TaxID=29313 RepID=UPI000848EAFE|nr:acyl-CoA dehydrogenase family protein [Mycobacterium shimoidei]MCV7260420.1 acyl-CoA dehydrogenase family protein [Mycobacterium shimoidei]ODR11299.1 acyl-CoA dehydrogenase [Mycobacterium shimoidei]ORW78151.1 acyl-CoA dehydrogenase [Mycobacterium shimoidei]
MPEQPAQPDAAELDARVDALVRRCPPADCDHQAFLGARFDDGLAWVWAAPEDGGAQADRSLQSRVERRLAAAGAPVPFRYNPIGLGMVAPALFAHGKPEQRSRYLRALFTGEEIWCQLFSEPSAGSDVAGLSTRARSDGDSWIVNGQKVWTSVAHIARRGLLIARTDPDVPKHAGLTAFVVDMSTPGVEARPLRQITGDAEFNEVYLTDVRIPDHDRIGEVGQGWQVATTMLMNERVALGGAFSAGGERPGTRILDAYRAAGRPDPVRGDRAVQLWIEANAVALTGKRMAAEARQPGPLGSALKLAAAEHNQRVTEYLLDLESLGSSAETVHGYLRARANTIEGGTSEIMRNILGERVLGLPAEPRVDKNIAWRDVPR